MDLVIAAKSLLVVDFDSRFCYSCGRQASPLLVTEVLWKGFTVLLLRLRCAVRTPELHTSAIKEEKNDSLMSYDSQRACAYDLPSETVTYHVSGFVTFCHAVTALLGIIYGCSSSFVIYSN